MEIMVEYVSLSPRGNVEKNPILSPTAPDFSKLTLLGFFAPPETTDQGFSRWGFATVPMSGLGANSKLLQPTADETYVFRTFPVPAQGPDRGLHILTLPLPLPEKALTRVVDETELLIFKQPVRDVMWCDVMCVESRL